MISPAYNIAEFVKAVRGKNYKEIISLADKEAVAAWRRCYRRGQKARAYQMVLNDFIYYLRSDIALPKSGSEFPEDLRVLHDELKAEKPQ